MQVKVMNEAGFQILTSAMSIGPSQTGYVLEVSADGKNFSPLFSVAANTTKMATGLAPNAYYRLKGNVGEVIVNWSRSCVTEGGAAGNELIPQESLPENADPGTVVALSDGGVYQFDGINWNEVGADDFSAYWTSAETKTYVDSADTIIYNSATTHIEDVERIMSSALNEFHTQIVEVSGDVQSLSAVTTGMTGNLNTLSGEIQSLSAATSGKADAATSITTYGYITGNLVGYNSQGIITGSSALWGMGISINGKSANTATNTSIIGGLFAKIYAPTAPGTAGDILVSTGGTPVWSAATFAQQSDVQSLSADVATIDTVVSAAIVELDTKKVESTSVHTIWKGTQAEYDLIQTKDPATFYIIIQ